MFMSCVAGGFSACASASFRSNFFRNISAPLGPNDIRWISNESFEFSSDFAVAKRDDPVYSYLGISLIDVRT